MGKTRHVRPDSLDGAGRRNFDCGRDWARRVAIYLHPQLEPILGLDRQRNGGRSNVRRHYSLVAEGVAISPERLVAGMLIGLGENLIGKRFVDEVSHEQFASFAKLDARKAMLLIGVRWLTHCRRRWCRRSFGESGELATFITAAIAVHTFPRLAIRLLVLVSRGMPVWQAALWAVFTSLPQPIMAVPSYLAVHAFTPFLPVGFGSPPAP